MNLEERCLETKLAFDGKIFKVYDDKVLLPNGKTAVRQYVSHNGGVGILPITESGEVVMVEQFRYPFKQVLLEIPAGKVELGENVAVCGERELSEEIGATTDNFVKLCEFYPTVGYSAEVIYIYLATNLRFSNNHLDADEFLSVKKIPFDEALQYIKEGKIKDGKTITALLYYNEFIK